MELLFEHDQVKLNFNPEKHLIKINWKGKISLQIYQQALNMTLEVMKNRQVRRILVDQREIKPLDETAQKWLYRQWFPNLIGELGPKIRLAIIPSPITFRNISSKSIAKRLSDKHHDMKIEYFTTEKPAVEFLMRES